MIGPAASLLLFLTLLQRTAGQNSTQQPGTSTQQPINSTQQPETSPQESWTVLEDGSRELRRFTGHNITAVTLQEARHFRIMDSDIQAIEENTFSLELNVTDATLEIINTTIHQWHLNDMDSFASINFIASTIKQLHSNGIRFKRRIAPICDTSQDYETTIRFNATTIEELHTKGIILESGRSLLELTNSKIGAMQSQAMKLAFGVELHVENTAIGAITPESLCNICSSDVRFERNRIHHAPPHSLHFGSPQCAPPSDEPSCRQLRRRVAINGTALSCGALSWLRDALASCGSLAVDTLRDYIKFRDSSSCADRPETVRSYLAREPEPEPEPERGWCASEAAAAGTAVALAVGFLAVGMLAGCCWRGAQGGASLHPFTRANSRHVHDRFTVGDAGISLPMDRREAKGADPSTHQDRASPTRYEAAPVREPASTPETSLLVPEPQHQTGRHSPAPHQQRTGRHRPAPPHQRKGHRKPAATPQEEPTYENKQWAGQHAVQPPEEPTYENKPWADQHAAQPPEEPTYENQQWAGEPAPQPHGDFIYENLHRRYP